MGEAPPLPAFEAAAHTWQRPRPLGRIPGPWRPYRQQCLLLNFRCYKRNGCTQACRFAVVVWGPPFLSMATRRWKPNSHATLVTFDIFVLNCVLEGDSLCGLYPNTDFGASGARPADRGAASNSRAPLKRRAVCRRHTGSSFYCPLLCCPGSHRACNMPQLAESSQFLAPTAALNTFCMHQ